MPNNSTSSRSGAILAPQQGVTLTQSQPSFGNTAVRLHRCRSEPGYEMHYTEHGAGPPVVFVHGSGPGANAWSNFSPNVGPITQAGFRCLLPDMIGFGYSSKPTGVDYTLDLFTPTLLRFLDALEIRRCALVGNSLGGAIAMRLAIDTPSASSSS